eukprot:1159362-Pelagomonas_calceolata.AAC.1
MTVSMSKKKGQQTHIMTSEISSGVLTQSHGTVSLQKVHPPHKHCICKPGRPYRFRHTPVLYSCPPAAGIKLEKRHLILPPPPSTHHSRVCARGEAHHHHYFHHHHQQQQQQQH